MADLSWFWFEVGSTLGLLEIEVTMKKPRMRSIDTMTTHLSGYTDDLLVEVGLHYTAHSDDPSFTFAGAHVDGLPAGLVVGEVTTRKPLVQLGDRGVWLECDGGLRRVAIGRAPTTRLEMEGLVLEQATQTVDLSSYLTTTRTRALCSIGGRLEWHDQRHRVLNYLEGEPYPTRREVKRSRAGDPRATEAVWAKERAVVDLARRTVNDSRRLSREATYRRPSPPT